jgi:hypothetical protein
MTKRAGVQDSHGGGTRATKRARGTVDVAAIATVSRTMAYVARTVLQVAARRTLMTALASTIPAPTHEGTLVEDSEIPTTELLKDAIEQAKELTKLEIALAKDEMIREVTGLKNGAILLGVAAGLGSVGLTLVIVAGALLLGSLYVALGIGVAIVVAAAICGATGWGRLPKKPMGLTAERMKADVRDLKERMV